MQADASADIEIRGIDKYVSRGGVKLEKALQHFSVSPQGKVCLDCGASTGGFADCLLQGGARTVYALDVGYGQLAWSIRGDPRVVVMERTNIRHVTADAFEHTPQLATVDVSFISLALVLPVIAGLLSEGGEAICLIKPQFEAGRGKAKKGVVRDADTHKDVLDAFMAYSAQSGFRVAGLTHSPVKGPKGNIEFLGLLRLPSKGADTEDGGGADGAEAGIDTRAVAAEAHEALNRSGQQDD
jgi:23S rRNA (cytidine1920-2'-O)/16S rRNA (cytidine1409-2'-O)-methyltransferase